MSANKSGLSYGDIPEMILSSLKTTAERENVFEFSILLSAIAVLVYRYAGYEKTNLNIKTADLSVKVEIDLTLTSTAGELFKQSQTKLEETLNGSFGRGLEIGLPGDVLRPVIRFINEAVDSGAIIPPKRENSGDNGGADSQQHCYGELNRQIARHFINILSDILKSPDVPIKDIPMLDRKENDWVVWCD
ncbi:MAG: hypothetical protein LBJ21_01415 [Acidobacteriota bacterium]|nr:hypothetical protein [Acidobacteriota bacterium]